MSKVKKRILGSILGVIILLAIAAFWYVSDYYHTDDTAIEYTKSNQKVSVMKIDNGLLFDGEGEEQAIIFYPGAKVEYTAYAPLMMKLAEQGTDCFLLEMPCNLAIFGMNRAERILEDYDYEKWYMAGHSLGGAMAAAFSAEHLSELDGLILLAAYPTKSLDKEGFSVLSLYGSEDRILSREKLKEGLTYMPEDYREESISGGNHAWFGAYGEQKGDGEAWISHEEQWEETVGLVREYLENQEVGY